MIIGKIIRVPFGGILKKRGSAPPPTRTLSDCSCALAISKQLRVCFGSIVRCVLLAACFSAVCPNSAAQIGRSVPKSSYYAAKRAYYAGEYRVAARGFAQALRSGVRIGQLRWIDSICYYTMLGEIHFRQGNLAQSLESHELAIQVHLANDGWMSRLRYPSIGPSNDRIQARIAWGARSTVMGDFPETMGSLEGSFDLTIPFQIGGAVNPAHLRSVDASEVVRCLAVSLRRRAQLLGPTSSLARSSSKITRSFANISAPPGHWVTAWVEVLYGLALMGEGQTREAIAHLTNGKTTGNFDHPLTGLALVEIGRRHLRYQEYELAVQTLHQASLAAARFEQPDVIEESFRYLTDAFLANEGRGSYPAVQPAILFAEREDYYRLAASLRLGSAELAVYANDPQTATTLLNQSRVIMARRDLLPTDLGGRLSYLDAIAQYRAGNRTAATKSLEFALAYMQRGSFERFHLGLVEALHAGGRKAISPRNAEALYANVLREPREVDWRTDPLETISMLLSKRTGAIERWLELLVKRKEYDEAVRVAEHLKRHRFYSTLPFGGRLLSLRWLIDGDANMLGKQGMNQQTHLRDKYPQLAKTSRRAEQIRLKLRELPLVSTDDDQQQTQAKLLNELEATSEQLENAIREIALRREPAKLVFPPQPSMGAIKRSMRKNQAVLMFTTTARGWHAWFIRKSSDDYWSIKSPKVVRRTLAELLKSIGNRNRNAVLAADDLADERWKQSAKKLWQLLVGELPTGGWDDLDEVVIIPDGVLWYLPFELLQIPGGQIKGQDSDVSLISQTRVRYAPVASLSVGDRKGHRSGLRSVVVGGQLFPRESSEYAGEMLATLKAALPDVEVVAKRKPPKSAKYTAGLFDRLVVWNDVNVAPKKPYDWSPAQYDRDSKSGALADWIEYPWGAPDQVVIPGFHTAAEAYLSPKSTGYEVFLAACGLMSTGTRTALVSRWRTGGKAPAVLVREFVLGIEKTNASDAWRTATELARVETLDPAVEPRVNKPSDDSDLLADHPFFWAGYLLLDTGAEPAAPDEPDGPNAQAEAAKGQQDTDAAPAAEEEEEEHEPPAIPNPEDQLSPDPEPGLTLETD